MRRRRRGLTLMELVLVMAIIVLLAAMAFPSAEALYASVQVEAGVDSVRAAWSEAMSHAVEEGRTYRFSLVPGKDKFRVAPDTADHWEGDGMGAGPADASDTPPFVLEGTLPRHVTFRADEVAGDGYVTTAVFLPDGTAQADAEVTLVSEGSRPATLRLRGLTGVVSVQRGGGE